jgi:hypothetical protein
MKTLNSLSGGKTSSYLAMHYPADYNVFALVCIDDVKCTPKDKSLVQFANDKLEKSGFLQKYGEFIATAEDDKILKVMMDLEQMLGSEIHWVRHRSLDFWIKRRKRLFSMISRYCTKETKVIPIAEFVFENCIKKDFGPVFMAQGIRYDEMERAKRGDLVNYKNKIVVGKHPGGRNKWQEVEWAIASYPLIYDRVLYHKIHSYWLDKDLQFPEDSNCIGCFWKDAQQLRKNWDDHPQKMQWFSDQEKKSGYFFKPHLDYEMIKSISIQEEFHFGTGSGCQAGFCTD